MNRNRIITTNRLARRAALCIGLLALCLQLFAHGGFDHVIGTVVTVANNVLTVKTAKGNVDVRLNEKTEITKNDQKAAAADLKPGTRVVVDIPEGSKDKIAHSVKIGVAGGATAPSHQ
ncbi:MAG TPA: hypothetical protein VKU19_04170 [Bryobacteraceae bacterium]|nr:hypothetical protein [Bryobacteraceae bacterium]